MNNLVSLINEQAAAAAFSKQAPLFDELYAADSGIQYKRKRVREHVLQFLAAHSSVLELNAGTGEDAIFFAKLGHDVHATDISVSMLTALNEKVRIKNLQARISNELVSFTDLPNLSNQGPYDLVFSNFGGLNCTDDLAKVLASFNPLLKPGGSVTLVILSKFCLWEFLLLFKGKFHTAFRRFSGKAGSRAHIEGKHFRCWYYHPSCIKKHIGKSFDLVKLEGLCTLVAPSYMKDFDKKYPRLHKWLAGLESNLKDKWPWKTIGDYFIITFRKKHQ